MYGEWLKTLSFKGTSPTPLGVLWTLTPSAAGCDIIPTWRYLSTQIPHCGCCRCHGVGLVEDGASPGRRFSSSPNHLEELADLPRESRSNLPAQKSQEVTQGSSGSTSTSVVQPPSRVEKSREEQVLVTWTADGKGQGVCVQSLWDNGSAKENCVPLLVETLGVSYLEFLYTVCIRPSMRFPRPHKSSQLWLSQQFINTKFLEQDYTIITCSSGISFSSASPSIIPCTYTCPTKVCDPPNSYASVISHRRQGT